MSPPKSAPRVEATPSGESPPTVRPPAPVTSSPPGLVPTAYVVPSYSPMYYYSMRPPPPFPTPSGGIGDVDTLKARLSSARAGTGEVAAVVASVTFQPRAAAFTSLIQAASKSKDTQKALEIFRAMQDVAGVQANTFTYSALISALAKSGQWELAEHYFYELKGCAGDDPRTQPNTVTFSALINAYEKGGQLDRALQAFQAQLDAEVDPDLITFSSLVSACERAGRCDWAAALLDMMHSFGLSGSAHMYNAVIAACGSDWNTALEVFLGMQCALVAPMPSTLSLLCQCAASAQELDHLVSLGVLLEETGCRLTAALLATVMRTLSRGGRAQQARDLWARWDAAGLLPADERARGLEAVLAASRDGSRGARRGSRGAGKEGRLRREGSEAASAAEVRTTPSSDDVPSVATSSDAAGTRSREAPENAGNVPENGGSAPNHAGSAPNHAGSAPNHAGSAPRDSPFPREAVSPPQELKCAEGGSDGGGAGRLSAVAPESSPG